MKINNINNPSLIKLQTNSKDSKNVEKKEHSESLDSVNISSEARELAKKGEAEKLEIVKQRISSNYYSRKDVLEATANAILKDLNSK